MPRVTYMPPIGSPVQWPYGKTVPKEAEKTVECNVVKSSVEHTVNVSRSPDYSCTSYYGYVASSSYECAQTFKVPSGKPRLCVVCVKLRYFGNPPDLQIDLTGTTPDLKPDDSNVIATRYISPSDIGAEDTYEWVDVLFDVELTEGETYAIVLRRAGDSSNYYDIAYYTGSEIPDGRMWMKSDTWREIFPREEINIHFNFLSSTPDDTFEVDYSEGDEIRLHVCKSGGKCYLVVEFDDGSRSATEIESGTLTIVLNAPCNGTSIKIWISSVNSSTTLDSCIYLGSFTLYVLQLDDIDIAAAQTQLDLSFVASASAGGHIKVEVDGNVYETDVADTLDEYVAFTKLNINNAPSITITGYLNGAGTLELPSIKYRRFHYYNKDEVTPLDFNKKDLFLWKFTPDEAGCLVVLNNDPAQWLNENTPDIPPQWVLLRVTKAKVLYGQPILHFIGV